MERYEVKPEARNLWLHWLKGNDVPVEHLAYGVATVGSDTIEMQQFVHDEAGHRVMHAKEWVTHPISKPLGEWADRYRLKPVNVEAEADVSAAVAALSEADKGGA